MKYIANITRRRVEDLIYDLYNNTRMGIGNVVEFSSVTLFSPIESVRSITKNITIHEK